MLTNTQMRDAIAVNLNDPRMFAIQAFLTRLIERKTHGDGISRYRIRDKNTNTDVVSLNDFITKISPTSLIADYFYYSDRMLGERTHPVAVNLTNFVVNTTKNSDEDSIYFNMFGGDGTDILLLLNYLSDNDVDLPLKIYEIRLIGKGN